MHDSIDGQIDEQARTAHEKYVPKQQLVVGMGYGHVLESVGQLKQPM